MAFVHIITVAAAAVQLAEVLNSEAADADGATTVVLDNLVVGTVGTTTDDVGCVTIVLLLDRKGVLADSAPPDVGDGAGTLAVNTLDLVGSNDDVGQRAALLDLENGVRVATFILARAVNTTVVHVHSTVERLARGDRVDVSEHRAAG